MEEQLEEARDLIKARRYSEARAILNKLDHPTARKWLQQLDQISPTLLNQEANTLTNRVFMFLGTMILILTLLLAFYAAFLRPAGAAQADMAAAQNTIIDIKSTVANVQKDMTDTKDTLGSQMSDVDKKLLAIQTASASDNKAWEYLIFQYSQYNFCTADKPPCISEIPQTDNPKYDAQLWEASKCDAVDIKCQEKEFRGLTFYLNRIGSDGWEMVNVVNTSSSTYQIEVYFKRIKQDNLANP